MKFKSLYRFAVLAALGSIYASAHAATYALLIGINEYPAVVDKDGKAVIDQDTGKPVDINLKGAVNDATTIRDILLEKYSVPTANIHMLTDKDANEDNFIKEWKWVLATAKAGDQVVFFYSGHGAQIPSKDPKEEDGLDEVIVLGDEKLVPDKLFAEIAKMTSESGVNATFVFDSCFSGGISREPGQVVKRLDFNTIPRAGFKSVSQPKLDGVKASFKSPKVQDDKGAYAFIMASDEAQPSLDVSGLKDIPAHGLFTLFFSAALLDNPTMGLSELVDATQGYVISSAEKLKGKQNPKAEFSNADRAKKPLVYKD